MQIRMVSAEQTRPLRHKILRPHQDFSQTLLPLDSHSESFHVAAWLDGRIVGVLSMFPENQEQKLSRKRLRLRGMAVDTEYQTQGIGRALVDFAVAEAIRREKIEVWCNARTPAVGFYVKLGFETKGAEFEIPGIGPHYVMTRALNREPEAVKLSDIIRGRTN